MKSSTRCLFFGLACFVFGHLLDAADTPRVDPRPILVERSTLNSDDKNEWLELFGIKANEIRVMTQKPAYGAKLRVEIWKPGDAEKPSHTQVFGGRLDKAATFDCTYRLYFMPPQFKAVASSIAYPAMVSWELRSWEKDHPVGFGNKERLAIPNDCLGVPGYELGPSAHIYSHDKEKEMKRSFPLFHFVLANGGEDFRQTPEESRKAMPHYVHIIGWFEPILEPKPPEPEPEQPAPSASSKNKNEDEPPLAVGSQSPDWSLTAIDGKPLGSANLRGKYCVLNFWATWCGPCRAEIPSLVKLQTKYSRQGVQFVGLAIDRNLSNSDMARFLKWNFTESPVNYPVAIAADDVQKSFGGVEAVPLTYILNPEGKVVFGHLGLLSEDALEKEISRWVPKD